jgi:hypothetical protein
MRGVLLLTQRNCQLLKELYQQITADAQAAVAPKLIELPGGKVLLVQGGISKEIVKNRVLHSDSVSSLESMLDWCGRHDEEKLFIRVDSSAVLVSANRDIAHETDNLRFDLENTAAFMDLLAWVDRPRNQQQVVNSLRTSLEGTFDEKILQVFRKLDFQRKNDGTRSITHTGESLGKSIEARAQSAAGEIPEVLVFTTLVYRNVPGLPYSQLRFALDVDPVQDLIRLTPIGDCIQDAYAYSIQAFVNGLKESLPESLIVCS